ncbi:MAG: hypothetical protein ABI760_04760 [Ferruginibacter sp.]
MSPQEMLNTVIYNSKDKMHVFRQMARFTARQIEEGLFNKKTDGYPPNSA